MAFLDVPSSSSSTSAALSNIVPEGETEREFREMLESVAESSNGETLSKPVRPSKGFSVKFKRVDEPGKKAFINVCHTTEIPEPADITEEELRSLLESDDAASYRVPLSLGLPHDEVDKKGEPCTAYDVILNSKFFQKCLQKVVFKEFVILLAAQGVEDKYSIVLSREDYVTLLNRKYVGSMPEHYIQDRGTTKPVPFIDEVGTPQKEEKVEKSIPPKASSNVHLTRVQKPGRCVEHLVADIELPHLKSANEIILFVAKNRIFVQQKTTGCSVWVHETVADTDVDVYLPLEVDVDAVKAQFDRKTGLLRIDAPIVEVL